MLYLSDCQLQPDNFYRDLTAEWDGLFSKQEVYDGAQGISFFNLS